MPFIGIGIHLLAALYFAVHAVRTGQSLYWLLILFSFPLFGSVVYFVAVYLPESRLQQGAKKAVASAAKVLDPTRELREARAAFDYTPTAQNRMRLAAALLDAGQAAEALDDYEACLVGQFANDLHIRLGAARAAFAAGAATRALGHLEAIRVADTKFHAEDVSLLYARALSASGRHDEGRAEFESAVARFGSFDAKAEYLIWALAAGDNHLSAQLQSEVRQAMERWNRHTRDLNRPLLHRLDAAHELARQRP